MTVRSRTVVVEQLPEILNRKQERVFLREIKRCMSNDCPRVVLDGSHVRHVNRSLIHMLLCCLEEALKRNGDVKLAALSPSAKAALQLAGVNRIFEMHDTTTDAVNSFRQPAPLHHNLWSAA